MESRGQVDNGTRTASVHAIQYIMSKARLPELRQYCKSMANETTFS